MGEKTYSDGLSEDKQYTLKAINRLGIGAILTLWGTLLELRQIGMIDENVSTWPFAFLAFGTLLIIGGIYRLHAGEKTVSA